MQDALKIDAGFSVGAVLWEQGLPAMAAPRCNNYTALSFIAGKPCSHKLAPTGDFIQPRGWCLACRSCSRARATWV
ncbi:hypothetical protein F7R20_13625 [Pseudomonas brassicacearum subsp. brassicacearum]|nr:hypothetical protein F7R20_13625 [Pseudomonas brassicacearum subsp. brassicacearum]QEO77010.1 hypothetical protein ELZ14_05415 [Pseudomonas brassicacearum]